MIDRAKQDLLRFERNLSGNRSKQYVVQVSEYYTNLLRQTSSLTNSDDEMTTYSDYTKKLLSLSRFAAMNIMLLEEAVCSFNDNTFEEEN